jgi:flagellar hook-length control protein FliK
LPQALASPEFPPALGAQVSLFARDGIERATIEINPPEMGPISVQIALDGSAARVDFLADAAATRQAIESALPTLASALRDAGLTLTGGGVFQQAPSSSGFGTSGGGAGQPGQGQSFGDGRPGGQPGQSGQDGGSVPALVLRTGAQRGLVDLVA